MRVKRVSFLLAALLSLVWSTQGAGFRQATIYYNEACADCAHYIDERLTPLLKELGVKEIIKKDFINDRSVRKELVDKSSRLGVPPELQGHFTVFIDERIVLEGHVPEGVIRDLFRASNYEKILVYQDLMGEKVASYKVWAFRGPVKEYPIDTPIAEYLSWFAAHKDELEPPKELWTTRQWLPLIVSTGLLDGINPCAFAVLLFFIAFLFTGTQPLPEFQLADCGVGPGGPT
ncbi:TPA: hypothetical protein EYP12_03345, partial [Candidatus Bipolaricaulota bacterium]|nr:hypothetical protein [Candidatus Bipolaricaulota bacterium]